MSDPLSEAHGGSASLDEAFLHLLEIESSDELRAKGDGNTRLLGKLRLNLSTGGAESDNQLARAHSAMVERSPRLVVRPVTVRRFDVERIVYLVVASDEAKNKEAAFVQWANLGAIGRTDDLERTAHLAFWHEFAGSDPRYVIGWWAIEYQLAWSLRAEHAAQLITDGFCLPS